MNKKSIIIVLLIILLPVLAFFGLTFNRENIANAQNNSKPQIIKFSSTMCLECKQVEKIFKELLPKYQDQIAYTEVIVDGRGDMQHKLIKKYNVQLVPTVIMLNSDGSQYKRIEGAVSKDEMEDCIEGLTK